jgi:hypothetical protein
VRIAVSSKEQRTVYLRCKRARKLGVIERFDQYINTADSEYIFVIIFCDGVSA